MTLAQQGQILAVVLWFLIVIAPGMLVATFANMMYVDGATRAPGALTVHTNMLHTVITAFVADVVWVILLKYVYLPAIGYDNSFLSLQNISAFPFTDTYQILVLSGMAAAWPGRDTFRAALLILFPVLIIVGIGLIARARGRLASIPPPPKSEWQ